jgi:hypothetical protein
MCAMNFDDCFLLQSDIGCIQGWCSVNFMKLNNSNTVVILSLAIQMFFNYTYKLMDFPVIHMCTIKDLGVQIDWKLHFHAHGDCIFSQYVRMLGLIHTITSSFSTSLDLLIFYITLVGHKLQYTSTVWNSVLSVDTRNLEHI